jgi:hypothetical protein
MSLFTIVTLLVAVWALLMLIGFLILQAADDPRDHPAYHEPLCGHEAWTPGCPICEAEADYVDTLLRESERPDLRRVK